MPEQTMNNIATSKGYVVLTLGGLCTKKCEVVVKEVFPGWLNDSLAGQCSLLKSIGEEVC